MDAWTLTVMALALAAGAVVKGATGLGLPLIAMPVLATALGLQHAVGILSVTIIVTNLVQCWQFRAAMRDPRLGFLPLFLVGGAVGVVLGTWALTVVPERILLAALGIILLVYVALRLLHPAWSLPAAAARRFGPLAGLGGGLLQGSTGISAPIGVTFIHAMAMERGPMVFAVSAMFLLFGIVQLPTLWLAGVMQPHWLLEGLLALVPIFLFMPVGSWLAGKLSARAFDRLMLIFLAAIGLKLVLGV